jgi:hypothetical protein
VSDCSQLFPSELNKSLSRGVVHTRSPDTSSVGEGSGPQLNTAAAAAFEKHIESPLNLSSASYSGSTKSGPKAMRGRQAAGRIRYVSSASASA